jgi:hypothetical protein
MGGEILERRHCAASSVEYEMSQTPKRGNDTEQNTGQQSQDALRHRQDAAHHKFHKSPQGGAADTHRGQRSEGGPQQDDSDINQSDAEQQPEIPKVGSRDAPGG